MKGLDFPIISTKVSTAEKFYDLSDPAKRQKYFIDKVGKEISELKDYMRDNTFIVYFLGKKQSGKGTQVKLLSEVFGSDMLKHLSVGDLVRSVVKVKDDEVAKAELFSYLEVNYRGFMPLEEAFNAFLSRDTVTLLPTEFILTLVKREIELAGRVNLFIDGFPRNLDQISYSLYFRELINYRNDPDLFVVLDVSEAIIDERIKSRRVCPKCFSSRNLKLFPTSKAEFDEKTNEFHLLCDNPECEPVRMVGKEGDELGIEAIRDRIEMDDELIRKSFQLHGIPKILLRNSMPIEIAAEMVDDYEITKISQFIPGDNGEAIESEIDWEFKDDNDIPSYSLKAQAVTVEFIKQLHEKLIK